MSKHLLLAQSCSVEECCLTLETWPNHIRSTSKQEFSPASSILLYYSHTQPDLAEIICVDLEMLPELNKGVFINMVENFQGYFIT